MVPKIWTDLYDICFIFSVYLVLLWLQMREWCYSKSMLRFLVFTAEYYSIVDSYNISFQRAKPSPLTKVVFGQEAHLHQVLPMCLLWCDDVYYGATSVNSWQLPAPSEPTGTSRVGMVVAKMGHGQWGGMMGHLEGGTGQHVRGRVEWIQNSCSCQVLSPSVQSAIYIAGIGPRWPIGHWGPVQSYGENIFPFLLQASWGPSSHYSMQHLFPWDICRLQHCGGWDWVGILWSTYIYISGQNLFLALPFHTRKIGIIRNISKYEDVLWWNILFLLLMCQAGKIGMWRIFSTKSDQINVCRLLLFLSLSHSKNVKSKMCGDRKILVQKRIDLLPLCSPAFWIYALKEAHKL